MTTPSRLALFSCSLLAALAFAQEGDRPRHGPPPEALQACASLAQGAACSVAFRGETLTGTCERPLEGAALACRPANLPAPPDGHGPRHAPPREAVTACSGLQAAAACAFTHDGTNLTGTCATPPGGSALACRPAGPPPGHRGPPVEAVSACTGLAADATCTFTHRERTVTGTCVAPPGGASGGLACRPDAMPPPPGP